MAQLVLLDQLSRNAFRGEAEAYAYDNRAQEVARTLVEAVVEPHHLPASAAFLVVTCMMHSERLELHEQAHTHHRAHTDSYRDTFLRAHMYKHTQVQRFVEAHVAVSGSQALRRQLAHDLPEHTKVLRRFGRYPHRNALYGRQSTPSEGAYHSFTVVELQLTQPGQSTPSPPLFSNTTSEAWLSSDQIPGWAMSQSAKVPTG